MLIHVSNENPANTDIDKDAIIRGLREQLQAAQKLSMLGTMSSMVVHEFNNLLTPVVNYAHLAKRNPKMVAKALEAATRAGDQAHAICSAFLGLSHEASDEPSPVRLGDLAQDCIAAMGRNPRRDNIVIHCDMHTGPVLLRRHDKLQQVLLNLLLNARNALLNKSCERWIRLSSLLKDDQITLRVADNGPGMTRDVCEKIFQPFFTTANDTTHGTGLGLTVCQNIVEEMGGTISVNSTPNVETVFTVCLPQETGYCPGE